MKLIQDSWGWHEQRAFSGFSSDFLCVAARCESPAPALFYPPFSVYLTPIKPRSLEGGVTQRVTSFDIPRLGEKRATLRNKAPL